jgi:hypothetical protein
LGMSDPPKCLVLKDLRLIRLRDRHNTPYNLSFFPI